MRPSARAHHGLVAAMTVAGLLTAPSLVAQSAADAEPEVVARSLQAQLGLMSGLGAEVAGSAGTLGRRLGTSPRFALSVRAAFANPGVPDLSDPEGAPSRESSYILPAVHAGVAAGLFDGFSVLPTVGGLFSIDLLAAGSLIMLPSSEGFDGTVSGVTLGARVGLLRESFTLPGVAVSVSRRWLGQATYAPGGASRRSVTVDPSVTAVRATVGKDLLAFGVLAGAGWDRYRGTWAAAGDNGVSAGGPTTPLSQDRMIWFGGLSKNFLILQISGEAGWAAGFDPVPGYLGAPHDVTSGTFFGSLAFRLTI